MIPRHHPSLVKRYSESPNRDGYSPSPNAKESSFFPLKVQSEKKEKENDEVEDEENSFLVIRRPHFEVNEDSIPKRFDCNGYSSFTAPDYSHPSYFYEDGCSTARLLRPSSRTLLIKDKEYRPMEVDLTYLLSPFNKPSILDQTIPEFKVSALQSIECGNCSSFPFRNNRVRSDGYFCQYCGSLITFNNAVQYEICKTINTCKGTADVVVAEEKKSRAKYSEYEDYFVVLEASVNARDDVHAFLDSFTLALETCIKIGRKIRILYLVTTSTKSYIIDLHPSPPRLIELLDFNDQLEGYSGLFVSCDKLHPVHMKLISELIEYCLYSEKEGAPNFTLNILSNAHNIFEGPFSNIILATTSKKMLPYFPGLGKDKTLIEYLQILEKTEKQLLLHSITVHYFGLSECYLRNMSSLTRATGGDYCFTPYPSICSDRRKRLTTKLTSLLIEERKYRVVVRIIGNKKQKARFYTASESNQTQNGHSLSSCSSRTSLSFELSRTSLKYLGDNFCFQIRVDYIQPGKGRSCVRILNSVQAFSESAADFYTSLDASSIFICYIRRLLSRTSSRSPKGLSSGRFLNKIRWISSSFLEELRLDQFGSREMFTNQLFEDDLLPDSLQKLIVFSNSAIRKKTCTKAIECKSGEIYREYLRCFLDSPEIFLGWLYPRITSLKELREAFSGIQEPVVIKNNKFILLPENRINSIDDLDEGLFVAENGEAYIIFKFELKEVAEIEASLTQVSDSDLIPEYKETLDRYLSYLQKLRGDHSAMIPQTRKNDIYSALRMKDIFTEDQVHSHLSLDEFRETIYIGVSRAVEKENSDDDDSDSY